MTRGDPQAWTPPADTPYPPSVCGCGHERALHTFNGKKWGPCQWLGCHCTAFTLPTP